MSKSNNVRPFELIGSVDELPKLTSSGFKKEGDNCRYLCKITGATISFAGDNSKFVKEGSKGTKLTNYIIIVLPDEQTEVLKQIIDSTGKENLPYNERDGLIEFKVKLDPKTKFMDKDKKPIKIDLKKVPCAELRNYVDATIDLAIAGMSNEFESKEGETISFTNLTAVQIKINETNSLFDYDCDFL